MAVRKTMSGPTATMTASESQKTHRPTVPEPYTDEQFDKAYRKLRMVGECPDRNQRIQFYTSKLRENTITLSNKISAVMAPMKETGRPRRRRQYELEEYKSLCAEGAACYALLHDEFKKEFSENGV